MFTATANTAPAADATEDLVRELRSTVIPAAVKGTSMTAYVDGETAGYIDLATKISDKLPSVIAIVVGLAFLLLLIAFRSIVVPLTSALMNLLSVAASYGVLTAVFQKGWGAELIGLEGPVPIASYVPLIMFAILFGLSMDYQVFLVTRVHEHYEHSRDNLEAVVDGLAVSARDHLRRADHGVRVRELHPRRRRDRQAVRGRARGRDSDRCFDRALRARPGQHGSARQGELVVPRLAGARRSRIGIEARVRQGPARPDSGWHVESRPLSPKVQFRRQGRLH